MKPLQQLQVALISHFSEEDIVQIARECAAAMAFAASMNLTGPPDANEPCGPDLRFSFQDRTCGRHQKLATEVPSTVFFTKNISDRPNNIEHERRLHLSWTLSHVLIPATRRKHPMLCKAGSEGRDSGVSQRSPAKPTPLCWSGGLLIQIPSLGHR